MNRTRPARRDLDAERHTAAIPGRGQRTENRPGLPYAPNGRVPSLATVAGQAGCGMGRSLTAVRRLALTPNPARPRARLRAYGGVDSEVRGREIWATIKATESGTGSICMCSAANLIEVDSRERRAMHRSGTSHGAVPSNQHDPLRKE